MRRSPAIRWGVVLGFALGGFFDGILLHQILQWHHLLSLVPGSGDLRMQVLWDGYFHALIYLIGALGLWGLWRAHRGMEGATGCHLLGALLVGFGLWHIVDSVLSHWVLGIHRIRVDSKNPLLWDLLWFGVFGLIPFVIGWLLLRGGDPHPRPKGSILTILLLGALSAGAGAWSLVPPSGQPFTAVVFRPDFGPQQVFAALGSTGARLVWSGPSMEVVVVDVAPERRWSFFSHGALLVSGAGVLTGCIDWSRMQALSWRQASPVEAQLGPILLASGNTHDHAS